MSAGNSYELKTIPGYRASGPGIQIGTGLYPLGTTNWSPKPSGLDKRFKGSMPPEATQEQMAMLRQFGIEWVMTSLPPEMQNLESYLEVKKLLADNGLKIYVLGNPSVHNMPEVTLNLPGRDAKIAEYLAYIRRLGEAGIHYTTYAHMGNGIWSSGRAEVRGGADSRTFDIDANPTGFWLNHPPFHMPLSHGREYTADEIWENYTYFIKQVVPVAEEAGVRIGIHPDDPPVPVLAGVPRPIFSSFDGYKRALEIADSPNIGMCLCIGCWLEGGAWMGKGVVETIRYFGGIGKLFKVHFRNVDKPIPEGGFTETYMDDGYFDMHDAMRALREVDFDGCVISDHLPNTAGGRVASESWSIGYMKAMIQAVNNEKAMGCL